MCLEMCTSVHQCLRTEQSWREVPKDGLQHESEGSEDYVSGPGDQLRLNPAVLQRDVHIHISVGAVSG